MQKKLFIDAVVFTAVLFVLCVGIEGTSYFVLKQKGLRPFPFLFGSAEKFSLPFGKSEYRFLDPHLGYGTQEGFKELKSTGENPIRIVLLGGGFTDPWTGSNPWPSQLQEILASDGYPNQIFNGAVRGYSSSQDLIKLIRDVLPLKPDLIISMEGEHDTGAGFSNDNPLISPYQIEFLRALTDESGAGTLVFANTAFLASSILPVKNRGGFKVSLGQSYEWYAPDVWRKNTANMNAVAKEFGISYLAALQPEPKDTDETQPFYSVAKVACREASYCADFSEVAENEIAQNVFTQLKNRGLIKISKGTVAYHDVEQE